VNVNKWECRGRVVIKVDSWVKVKFKIGQHMVKTNLFKYLFKLIKINRTIMPKTTCHFTRGKRKEKGRECTKRREYDKLLSSN
jgi:hypothetical protein